MPKTEIMFFRREDGSIPFLDWAENLAPAERVRCDVRLRRLADMGHALRRPEVDYLRDGIYEIRTRSGTIQLRILYFFHGSHAVVLSHGLVKKEAIPDREIDLAVARRQLVTRNSNLHCHRGTI